MRKTVFTESAPKPIGPYNQAIDTGNIIFLAGQLGIDPSSGKLEDGIEEQTRRAFINVKSILEAAGYSMDNVVKVTCLLSDMTNFKSMNEVYATFFTADYPARTAFQAARLPLDALVELEVIATK